MTSVISSESLRNVFYFVGGLLVAVAGLDASLTVAGLQPLHLIPENIGHIMAVVGAAALGYAKTGRLMGDITTKDAVALQIQSKLEASQPVVAVPPPAPFAK